MRRRYRPNLHHQTQLVPVVPALDNLAVRDSLDRSASDDNFLSGRSKSKKLAFMGHGRGPSRRNFVALLDGVIDYDIHIRESVAKVHYERLELIESDVGSVLGLTVAHDIRRRHLVDRFQPALVPDFFKPAANQSAIFLRHTAPPRESYPLWPFTVRSACKCCNACTRSSPRCRAAMPSAAARAAESVVMVGIRACTAARRIAFSSNQGSTPCGVFTIR